MAKFSDRHLPLLRDMIVCLRGGIKLYRVARLWLPVGNTGFFWGGQTDAEVTEDEAKAIGYGGENKYLTIGPEEKVGELTLRWEITPTTEGHRLVVPDYVPPPAQEASQPQKGETQREKLHAEWERLMGEGGGRDGRGFELLYKIERALFPEGFLLDRAEMMRTPEGRQMLRYIEDTQKILLMHGQKVPMRFKEEP